METYQWVFKLMDVLLFVCAQIKRSAIMSFLIREFEWLPLGVNCIVSEGIKRTGKALCPTAL